MYSQFLILLGLLVLSAIFSASETAFISVSQSKVDELVANKVRKGVLLKKLKKNPHKLLITVLIGNNIVNIGASAYAAIIFTEIFASSGVGIATGVMTFLILVFGEITPKSFAHQHSVGFSLLMARPINFLQFVLFPFIWFFESIVKLTNRFFGAEKGFTVTEGELVAMLKIGAQEGSINKQERELIENVLEFNDIEVCEVMTPRVVIEAFNIEMTIQEAVDYAIEHTHSRIPVYEGSIDNIVGILTIKDLLQLYNKNTTKKKIKNVELTPPLTVPKTKKIDKLFREFQRKHIHMAIVIDEHGGTAGLVTLEDLLEEIVGEIVDEFDVEQSPIEILNPRNIYATGTTVLEDVNDFFHIKISNNDHDTVNTLLTDHLNRFPREGEIIKFERVKIEIINMKKNLVDKVKITKLKRKRL